MRPGETGQRDRNATTTQDVLWKLATTVFVIYLAISIPASFAVRWLERRFHPGQAPRVRPT